MATINDNSGNNNLLGTSANDLLNGLGDNDTLNGGAGIDTLVGGSGNDIYIVNTTTDIIREYSGGGTDTVQSSVSYTLGAYLNNLTLTGTSAINGTGNSYDNIITGNSANNILDGRGGIDTLIGGRGNDSYIVNSTTDEIVEYSGGGTDTVQSSVSYTLGAYVNNLVLTGTSAIDGIGNNLDNTITGNDANNILLGEGGNDILGSYYNIDGSVIDNDALYGGDGNDTLKGSVDGSLFGGAGDDDLSGGYYDPGPFSGNKLYMYGGEGNDNLRGVVSTMYGGNGNDTLDVDASVAYGGDGNDSLFGEGNAYGGDGNDVLYMYGGRMNGGNGNDTLTGWDRSNSFEFNAPTEGVDTIVGFVASPIDSGFGGDLDLIYVSHSGFGGGLTGDDITGWGPSIIPEQFVLGTAAVDASDRFIYNNTNGALFFDIDGTGISEQVQFATLVGAPDITNIDILVVDF